MPPPTMGGLTPCHMDLERFVADFDTAFPPRKRNTPTHLYSFRIKLKIKRFGFQYCPFEPLRDIDGMIGVKKQRLLNLAYAHLDADEAYLEVGTWQGKSLIAAMTGNPPRPTFACDDFSEWFVAKGRRLDLEGIVKRNLTRYGLEPRVTFYREPFQQIFTHEKLPAPIGVYFYDAAHDHASQYAGVKLAEPFLADEAIVVVDDWRLAPDSQSYAKAGTEQAIAESPHDWRLLYELPARFNGDRAMWWNGVAVYAFRARREASRRHAAEGLAVVGPRPQA